MMKFKTVIAAVSLLSIFSFNAMAVNAINAEQAKTRVPIGSISVFATDGSPTLMQNKIAKKAEAMGASSYHIIQARQGSNWHYTAEAYK